MNRLIHFFKGRICAILLFHAGLLLFNWPLLSITADKGGTGLFNYLFIAWTAVVAALAFLGYSISRETTGDEEE